jgi:rod shape-determining protein MreD
MWRFVVMFLMISFFTFLQSVLLVVIPTGSWQTLPDLPLIILIFFSIEFGRSVAQGASWLSGLVVDLGTGVPLGFHALLQLCLGAGFGSLRKRFRIESIMAAMTIISVATVIKQGLLLGLVRLLNLSNLPLDSVTFLPQRFLITIFLNAVMAVPFFFLMHWAMPRLGIFIRVDRRH